MDYHRSVTFISYVKQSLTKVKKRIIICSRYIDPGHLQVKEKWG